MDDWKACNQCGTTRLRTEFYRSKRTGDGLQTVCKWCSLDNATKWRKDNPERARQNMRAYMQRRRAA